MADADNAAVETKTEPTNGSAAPPPPAATEPERLSFSRPEFASRIGQAERSAVKKLLERAREAGVELKDADDMIAALAAGKQTRAKAEETVESLRGALADAKRAGDEKDGELRRVQIERAFDRRARALGVQHPELLDRAFEAWCGERDADPLIMADDDWKAFGEHARATYPVLFAPATLTVAPTTPPAKAPAAPEAGGAAKVPPAAAQAGAGAEDLAPEELAAAKEQAARHKWPLERVIKTMREEKAKRAGALNPTVWSR